MTSMAQRGSKYCMKLSVFFFVSSMRGFLLCDIESLGTESLDSGLRQARVEGSDKFHDLCAMNENTRYRDKDSQYKMELHALLA